jgi:hypothetical protein
MFPLTALGFLASMLAAGAAALLAYRKKDTAAALLVGILTLLVCNGLFFGLLAILLSFSNM